jgi:adenylate cyclase
MSIFNISPKHKRNILRILPFGILWAAFGMVYTLLERGLLGNSGFYPSTGNSYEFSRAIVVNPVGSAIMGWILGSAETLFLSRYFSKRSFGVKIILKTLLYLIVICLFLITLTFITNSWRMGVPFYEPGVVKSVFIFFSNFAFWSIVIYMGAIINVTLFISEVSDNLGQGILMNFLTGKYHQPREELRIFMFLDMKSSTTIAEKLGHVQYYKLLNWYYADITDAILQTYGEIYQYVGDEIIVSWQFKNGLRNNNCLLCFFLIKKIFEDVSEKYMKEFRLVPGFKAGLHHGKVTTGEIGVVKKEIIFTGDVLNTTARIQSLCNEFGVDILISDNLVKLLKTDEDYNLSQIGETELRGKDEKIKLLTVKENSNNSAL